MIYSVFLRNHFKGKTFGALDRDLNRIRDLGADWIWFLPFYPVGSQQRKGALGSPYAICDFRGLDPSGGSIEDFSHFVKSARACGVKVMIDIVFHHTAPDHPWTQNHTDYYHLDSRGRPAPAIAEWSDVVDLNFSNANLQKELIETLNYWAELGVEGFRCDVAPMVPMSFWRAAKAELQRHGHQIFWLAETLSRNWLRETREKGLVAHSDEETLEVFDLCYDYINFESWLEALSSREGLQRYIDAINEELLRGQYAQKKLRFVENHDQMRIRARSESEETAKAWELFMALLPGEFLVYAGQEFRSQHHPTLFDLDPVQIGAEDGWIKDLVKKTAELKSQGIFTEKISLSESQMRIHLSTGQSIDCVLLRGFNLFLSPGEREKFLNLDMI